MRAILAVFVFLTSSMAVGMSNAQQPGSPAQPIPPAQPTPPATPQNSPPEIIAPRQDDTTGKASSGVVRPPNVDPGMNIKPPADAPQSMPIIPPPGAPGGNPQVVP